MPKNIFILIIFLVFAGSALADYLPEAQQKEIIENYLKATGQSKRISTSLALGFENELELPSHKCAMPQVMDFSININKIDKKLLQAYGLSVAPRDPLDFSYVSPSGFFKIHYNTTDSHIVLNPKSDSDGDGVPNYVESIGIICDSVLDNLINRLGYPLFPNDGTLGGDDKYDVYLKDIDAVAFGYTNSDDPNLSDTSIIKIHSFITIDNDYQRFYIYKDRPLDAARVTIAHELFHAVQFGIDYTENEIYGTSIERRWWMEMSATWMEEELYDNINDYYFYIPFFYTDPRLSIQQFSSFSDLRPYGGVVFPIYLSEKYGADFIREIWSRCDSSKGSTVLLAIESILDTMNFQDSLLADTGLTYFDLSAFPDLMSEFGVWNFFTGLRANLAPEGYGFEERENYPAYPDKWLPVYDDFPRIYNASNIFNPDHNASSYIKLDQLNAFQKEYYYNYIPGDSLGFIDTVYWECVEFLCIEYDITTPGCIFIPSGCCLDSVCNDSAVVYETLEGFDWVIIDTLWFKDSVEVGSSGGTNFIYYNGSSFVDSTVVGYDTLYLDSSLTVYPGFDGSFTQPWGLQIILQMNLDQDSFLVVNAIIDGETEIELLSPTEVTIKTDTTSPIFSKINFINPEQYRSVTFVFSPSSEFRDFYQYQELVTPRRGLPKKLGLYIEGRLIDSLRQSTIDFQAIDVLADILFVYPNPAVVDEMNGGNLKIQYQVPTDNISKYLYTEPRVLLNIFTIAGELVSSVDTTVQVIIDNGYNTTNRVVLFEVEWDMKNSSGVDVASGVYFISTTLFSGVKGKALAEKVTKALIIR